jgi:DNA adenine methylase
VPHWNIFNSGEVGTRNYFNQWRHRESLEQGMPSAYSSGESKLRATGAGFLKHGENGKGIKSRWYPTTLKKRILEIIEMRDHMTFIHSDGFVITKKYAKRKDFDFYIDPPYTVGAKQAGKRLYKHSEIDHDYLFELVNSLSGEFLMSSSDDRRVRDLAKRYNFDALTINMKNSHHANVSELIIGKNLSWAL